MLKRNSSLTRFTYLVNAEMGGCLDLFDSRRITLHVCEGESKDLKAGPELLGSFLPFW